MVQSPSWEANWFAASQEIPRISRKQKVHYRTHEINITIRPLKYMANVSTHLGYLQANILHKINYSCMCTLIVDRLNYRSSLKKGSHTSITVFQLKYMVDTKTTVISQIYVLYIIKSIGARGGTFGWGTALQAGRLRVRLPMVPLEFCVYIILPAAPWGRISL